jgi:hypothetical protein
MTDVLEALSKLTTAYDNTLPLLIKLISQSNSNAIVDFGSGAAGPLLQSLLPTLKESFPNLRITLTDLYPNKSAAKKIVAAEPGANYLMTPVNMCFPPKNLEGTRLMFTCFHHLNREQAKQTLQSAIDAKVSFGVFEVTKNSGLHLLSTISIPFLILLVTPFIKEKRLLRFITTYAIPIVPLGCFIDGLISNLRTYSKTELNELSNELENAHDYKFEVGEFPIFGPINGTFMIGYK